MEKALCFVLVSIVILSGCINQTTRDDRPVIPLPGTDGDDTPDGNMDTPDDSIVSPDLSGISYTYNATFEPPSNRVLFGMGQFQKGNQSYLEALPDDSFQPASELSFVSLADTPRGWDPVSIQKWLSTVDEAGRIPHLSLMLRGLDKSQAEIDGLSDPFFGIDNKIAEKDPKYMSRVQDLAMAVKQFGKPTIVRIGGEFNGSWNGYHPYDFPIAFRNIVEVFRENNVDNAAFVWCYEPAAPNDFDMQNTLGDYKWFPGDDVIDWYCIDVFNVEDFSGSEFNKNGELSPYGKTLRYLDMAFEHNKPVMIGESSVGKEDITSSLSDGQMDWNNWFVPFFELINTHPVIKWVHYINYDWTLAGSYQEAGWKNGDITHNAYIQEQFFDEIGKEKYLHADEIFLLNEYAEYK